MYKPYRLVYTAVYGSCSRPFSAVYTAVFSRLHSAYTAGVHGRVTAKYSRVQGSSGPYIRQVGLPTGPCTRVHCDCHVRSTADKRLATL